MTLQQRTALAEKIRAHRQRIAEAATAEFLNLHPDWQSRFGERARQRGIEDARYHQDFLAGAIEAGSPAAFRDYALWCSGLLSARGMAPAFLVENLQQVEQAIAAHLTEAERSVVADFVRAGCQAAVSTPASSTSVPPVTGLLLTYRLFLQALLQGQRQPALTMALEALRQGHSLMDVYVDIIQASLYEVGHRWQENRLTVAEEHIATGIAQFVLAHLYDRMAPPVIRRGRAVITGVEGELHQIGANLVADALEADGWNVQFLGTNLPSEGIVKAIQDHRADVVGISTTMLFHLPKVRLLIANIRAQATKPVKIVVGGSAFRSSPNLISEIGADGFAVEARSAVSFFRGLTVPTVTSPA